MRSGTFLSTALVFTALGLASPASALDLNATVGIGVGANIGVGAGASHEGGNNGGGRLELDTGAAAAATLNAGGRANAAADLFADMAFNARVNSVVELIATSKWEANGLAGHDSIGAVFDVNAWLDATTTATFDAVVAANVTAIADLHAAIAANAALALMLQAQGIDANSVVAIGAAADGSLVAFVY